MIRVFGQADTSFTTNGDAVLSPLKAKVRKEDNGEFYLSLETGLEYLSYLVEGNIVVAPTPQGEQPFRIHNAEKQKNRLITKCKHVFYDAENYLIADSYVENKDCNDALDHLNSATDQTSPFTTISDITTVNSYRCVRTSLAEAVSVVIERWGGHLVRDGWTIGVRNSIGQDNGVVVRYRKNLKDITCTEDWSEVVTKLLPVGKDGILLNAIDDTASIYVESETQYSLPYTKTVSFEQEIEEDDYDTEADYLAALVADLQAQAESYVDEYCTPHVNYTLKANLEKVTDIGDTIEVIDERIGVNLFTNVIAFEYDCILGKYTELEFGNFKSTLSGLLDTVSSTATTIATEKVTDARVALQAELTAATDEIWGRIGDSYVIYEEGRIIVVDTLPKEDATNVMVINSAGIGFSNTGYTGTFNSAWLIDGTFDCQVANLINLTFSMASGGVIKLGNELNQNGSLEVYDADNNLVGYLNNEGLRMNATDGSYVVLNATDGLAGYDADGNKIYWVSEEQFHMSRAVVEDEITLASLLRLIPIDYTDANSVRHCGIGFVPVSDEE